jgi:hypothetical protein
LVHVIVVVPSDTALQIPVPVPIVATDVVLLVHAPALPYGVMYRPVLEPIHVVDGPKIGLGELPAVTDIVVKRPEPKWYVIVAVPTFTYVRIPVDEPTTATAVLLLLHVPPGTVMLRVSGASAEHNGGR